MRGHGFSKCDASDEGNLSIDLLTSDVELVLREVLKDRDYCKLVLVGHSLGGSVASHLCARLFENPGNMRVCGSYLLLSFSNLALQILEEEKESRAI
jgi:pimeloyl-ACP methyl ester carboxylesterase